MASSYVDAGGRRLAIRKLDRVIFPQTGTTKAELLDYYARVADTMLTHLRDRLLHMHRYPEGVDGPRFWQKTPVAWDELQAALDRGDAGALVFERGAVLERIARHGDLFAPVLTERQELRVSA